MTAPRQPRPGFTLIEVMLAMTIGTAVILLAISKPTPPSSASATTPACRKPPNPRTDRGFFII